MIARRVVGVVGLLLGATALTPTLAADMTIERALNPQREPQNWILHHGNYQGHRFSLLKEINTETIGKNLKPAFTVALGGFQSGGRCAQRQSRSNAAGRGRHHVRAGRLGLGLCDRSHGRQERHYQMEDGSRASTAPGPGDVACCGVNNRGVALWKDKVISIALDGRMFAINKATGEVVWERKVADPALGETLTMAPLVVRDLAIVGAAGGEFGIRGYIEATDLNTGKAAWRTYTIPGAGEPGNETWKDGKERWKHGGGSVWETATYDPRADTIYQGIGNAGPDWDTEYRPGDNKWAASVLALSPNNGKIKWGFQYTPNDPYDFDEISEHPIINAKVNGEDRKLVVHAARNGFFYALDRTNGSFVAGKQYVDQLNWTPGLDPKTGKPLNYDPNADVQIYTAGMPRHARKPAGRRNCARRISAARTGNRPPTIRNSACSTFRRSRAATRSTPWSRRISPTRAARETARVSCAGRGRQLRRRRFQTVGAALRRPQGASIRRPARSRPAFGCPTPTTRARLPPPATSSSSARSTARSLPMMPAPCRSCGPSMSAPASTRRRSAIAMNGKQYIAVLAGSKQSPFVIQNAPELKNTSTASMLYVFSL